MGGSHSSSSSKATQNTNQNSISVPLVPTNVAGPMTDYLSTVGGLIKGAADPSVAQSLVPGATASQTAGYNAAAGLSLPSTFGQAGQAASQLASGGATSLGSHNRVASLMDSVSAAPLISQFADPFINSVVNSTLAVQNQQNAQQQAQLAAQNGTSGAFGGSRYGVAKTNLATQQGLNNAQLASGLYSNAFNTALGAAQTQAQQDQAANAANQAAINNMKQFNATQTQQNQQFNAAQQNQNLAQAASLFGNLATAQNNAANQNIGTQIAAGQDQRSVQAQQNAAQLNYLATLQSLFGVSPESLFGQQNIGNATTTGSSSGSTTSFGFHLPGQ